MSILNDVTLEDLIRDIVRTPDSAFEGCSLGMREFCPRAINQEPNVMSVWLNTLVRRPKKAARAEENRRIKHLIRRSYPTGTHAPESLGDHAPAISSDQGLSATASISWL